MQKFALVLKSSNSLLVHLSQVPCEYNGTQNSIEWFCILDKILRASATLSSSGSVCMYAVVNDLSADIP